jgi:hypothetical protein
MMASLLVLATASTESSWWPKLALAYTGFGAGVGFVITGVRTEAMTAVEKRRQAVAAGTVQLSYQLGAAVGVAGVAGVVSQYGETRLDDAVRAAGVSVSAVEKRGLTNDELAGKLGTVDVETELPDLRPAQVEAVVGAMQEAFVAAMTFTMSACAVLTALALSVAVALLGRRRGEAPP